MKGNVEYRKMHEAVAYLVPLSQFLTAQWSDLLPWGRPGEQSVSQSEAYVINLI